MQNRKWKMENNLKIITIFVVLISMSSWLVGCGKDISGQVPDQKVEKSSVSVTEVKNAPLSFQFTIDDFKKQYNTACIDNGFDDTLLMRDYEVYEQNGQQVFKANIIRNTFLMGTYLPESGYVKDVMVHTMPIVNELVVADQVSVQTIALLVISPKLTTDERRTILEKLHFFDKSNKNGLEARYVYKNIEYLAFSNKADGMNFVFIPKK